MYFSYLGNKKWITITREERYYCSHLYYKAKNSPEFLVDVINELPNTGFDTNANWEFAFEVCFYRDYLKSKGISVRKTKYSPKRTFDLCLFSEDHIIILEAKVQQGFKSNQTEVFTRDIKNIKDILKRQDIAISLVALASSNYLPDTGSQSQPEALKCFERRYLTWKRLSEIYDEELFQQANDLYGK